jgi:hypothetical protein
MRRQITSISDSCTINYKTRCNGLHWNFGGVFFLEWPNVQIPKISDEYSKLGSIKERGSGWLNKLNLTTHTSLSLIRRGFAPSFVNYKKACSGLAAASDKVYQLLVQCWWFSPGTPASSTTKTGRHDIAEILLKVALNTKNQIRSNLYLYLFVSPNLQYLYEAFHHI